jgi:hypothetical protein
MNLCDCGTPGQFLVSDHSWQCKRCRRLQRRYESMRRAKPVADETRSKRQVMREWKKLSQQFDAAYRLFCKRHMMV